MTASGIFDAWPRAIFFDFDGVILESADIKTHAFARLFEDHGPQLRDRIVAYHVENSGVSRFEKFDYIYAEILKRPLTNAVRDELAARFQRLVYEEVLAAPFVPGALEFLQQNSSSSLCFVISATPHEELNRLVDARGLRRFLRGVYGAPTKKYEWIRLALRDHALEPGDALVVGDSAVDAEAAEAAVVPFIGRLRAGHPNPFGARACLAIVEDLRALKPVLSSHHHPLHTTRSGRQK